MVNPDNGNAIGGEATSPNFSRGGRFKAILMDEFAFWDDDAAAWGSTADTTNCRIVVTTPGNRPSKAKRLRYGIDGEKIKVITLDRSLDPRKDSVWEKRERDRRSTEDFSREIEINWDTSIGGKLYSTELTRVMFGKDPSTISTAELKRDILVYAKTDPREFLNILNDPELQFQAKVRLFFESKLLVLRNNDKEVWFNTTTKKTKMLGVPYGESPYEITAQHLQSDEGMDSLKMLEALSEQ